MIEVRIEQGARVASFTGEIHAEDLRSYIQRLRRLPGFDEGHDSLVDLRAVTAFDISSSDVGDVERRARDVLQRRPRRIAFVVGSDVAFGFARSYQIQHSDSDDDVRIFRSITDARSWLGLLSP